MAEEKDKNKIKKGRLLSLRDQRLRIGLISWNLHNFNG